MTIIVQLQVIQNRAVWMYISNTKYRLGELSHSNLEASAKLLAESFFLQNKTWATIRPTLDEMTSFMIAKTKEMLSWQLQLKINGIIDKNTFLNFVYLDENDDIVGVWTNFELTQYLNKVSKVYLPQFAILEKYGEDLEKSISRLYKLKGNAIYSMFSAIKPELTGTGAIMYFWLDMSHYLYMRGFRMIYGRCSNVKSYKLILKAGGQMLSKLKAIENGRQITLSFLKWKLYPVENQNVQSLTTPTPML